MAARGWGAVHARRSTPHAAAAAAVNSAPVGRRKPMWKPELPAGRITEGVFQTKLIDLAHWYDWHAVHYRKARRQSGGYSTPVQGDPGGPDLLLAKGGVVLLAELKSNTGSRTSEQREWAGEIGPVLYRLWRPRDWDAIDAELAAG